MAVGSNRDHRHPLRRALYEHCRCTQRFRPRGIEWSDIETKYRALMPQSRLPEERMSEILRTIRNFEQLKSVSQLTSLLS